MGPGDEGVVTPSAARLYADAISRAAAAKPHPFALPDGQLAEVSETGGLVLTDPWRELTHEEAERLASWLMTYFVQEQYTGP